ncbi:hypothetical protein KBA63_01655 [Candidatus Woesebacteria bacterium]|nr:hypothetical protein [Candidatus Woesebacteria bacterium]
MSTLSSFVAKNIPDASSVTLGNLKLAAIKAGFQFKETKGRLIITATWGEEWILESSIAFSWKSEVDAQNGVVRYTPTLGFFHNAPGIIPGVLEAAGYPAVEVSFPEPVVTLPIPRWVKVWVQGDYGACDAGAESIQMFKSEAELLATDFTNELKKLS